jgi:hypothetical protein
MLVVKGILGSYDLSLDGHDDLVDAFPMIGILSLSIDDLEALEDVYDIIDPPSLDSKLSGALIKVQHGAALATVQAKEPAAQLSKALLFAAVLELSLYVPLTHLCWGILAPVFFARGIFIIVVNLRLVLILLFIFRFLSIILFIYVNRCFLHGDV